jgi:hypothetical protein
LSAGSRSSIWTRDLGPGSNISGPLFVPLVLENTSSTAACGDVAAVDIIGR